jgi:hypothetical protein
LNRLNHFNNDHARSEHRKNCRDACCLRFQKEEPDYTPKLGEKHADEDTLHGYISVTFDLCDDDSKPVDVDVRVSLDNGVTFVNCTPAPGSESTRGMATCPHGTRHEFLWDTLADLGRNADYEDVLILVLTHGRGGAVLGPVSIDNTVMDDDDIEAAA